MLDTVKINHVQHISFTQSRLTDAVSVILSELLSYEHPSKAGGISYAGKALCSSHNALTRKYGLPAASGLLLATRKRAASAYRQLLTHLVFLQLILNVLFDSVRILPCRVHIVPTAPKFTAPILVLQFSELLVQHRTALPFQVSHKARHRILRRNLYQHMHMVRAHFCLYDLHMLPLTQLPQNLSHRQPLFFIKYLSPIFRGKYYVILAVPLRSVYKELHADHETGAADNK